MGNINIGNERRIYFDSFKKYGKTSKALFIFIYSVLLGIVLYIVITNILFEEFRTGRFWWGNIIMSGMFVITVCPTIYLCSKRLFYENGSMYCKNIFKSKTVKFEPGMRVVLGTGKTPIDKTVIIRKDGVELFRYNIEMFNDDAPRMRENAEIIKEICEKYDMEFVNYWGDMRYE